MKYEAFRIENFKGIRDTEISLRSKHDARVFTLVGLNESGKTTLLEAIHSFSPDSDTQIVVGAAETSQAQRTELIPRHRVSDFTGSIKITATVSLETGDADRLAALLIDEGLQLTVDELPAEFNFTRAHVYRNSDFLRTERSTTLPLKVRSKARRTWRDPTGTELTSIHDALEYMMPKIAYFPTFVFSFPEKIYLGSNRTGRLNAFYRQLFQDILDYDGRGHRIKEQILDRVRKPEYRIPYIQFFPLFKTSNESEKIQQVFDRAAQTITTVVFSKWNRIFGEKTKGIEIILPWEIEKGSVIKDEKGNAVEPTEHDVSVQFRIKDGVNRYDVKDRSLGFRWFFAFLLFTQFRAARQSVRATVFLFDEPASNLHSAAQQKLLDSFPQIAQKPHLLLYSTHSHYMIEPKWLEQTYIVESGRDTEDNGILDSARIADESINVVATPYRKFVNENPGKVSYFQPILDRLEVLPSKLDPNQAGVIVEGKSDYYMLRYLLEHLRQSMIVFPASGAATMGALISLHRGWGFP